MLICELFNYADYSPTQSIKKTQTSAQEKAITFSGAWSLVKENSTVQLDEANISDILTARELIGLVMSNRSDKKEYFDFLGYLRNRYGRAYSTEVHKQAAKLVKRED